MESRPATSAPAPDGDPWAAFGYLVAGVAFYGGLGWGLSVWLDAPYLIPIGILVGAGLGMYMVFTRYLVRESDASNGTTSTPMDDDAARDSRPAGDDRGETA